MRYEPPNDFVDLEQLDPDQMNQIFQECQTVLRSLGHENFEDATLQIVDFETTTFYDYQKIFGSSTLVITNQESRPSGDWYIVPSLTLDLSMKSEGSITGAFTGSIWKPSKVPSIGTPDPDVGQFEREAWQAAIFLDGQIIAETDDIWQDRGLDLPFSADTTAGSHTLSLGLRGHQWNVTVASDNQSCWVLDERSLWVLKRYR